MSNKEILEDNDNEELIEYSDETLTDAEVQRKRLLQIAIGVVVLIVLIVGGFLWYRSNKQSTEKEAALKLSRIRPFYDAGQFDVSLNGVSGTIRGEQVVGLTAIANQYSGAESGRLAALYAGGAFASLGRYAEAAPLFDQASGASAEITKMGGLAGLASCKAQANSSLEAAKLYEDAAAIGAKLGDEDRYRLFAALHYEKAGQKDKALALFRAIAASTEFSEAVSEAKAGVIRLGGTLE
jgi:tetratricopeptide (TPR) repeat protein